MIAGRTIRSTQAAVAVACVVLATGIALGEGGGDCVSVRMSVTFVLPDGSVHEPGRLRLCVSRRLTPVTDLYAVKVDGCDVGMFPGRRVEVEESDTRPYLTFLRNGRGEWELIGLTRPPRTRGERATTVVVADWPERGMPPGVSPRRTDG